MSVSHSTRPRSAVERLLGGLAIGAAILVLVVWIASFVLAAGSRSLVPFEPFEDAIVQVNRATFDPSAWSDPEERRREAREVYGTSFADEPMDIALPDDARIVTDEHVGTPALYRVSKSDGDQPLQMKSVYYLRTAVTIAGLVGGAIAALLAIWLARRRAARTSQSSQNPA